MNTITNEAAMRDLSLSQAAEVARWLEAAKVQDLADLPPHRRRQIRKWLLQKAEEDMRSRQLELDLQFEMAEGETDA